MPFLIAIFARAGLSQGLSRVLGYLVPILAVVALIAAVGLWFHAHDKQVIENHDAVQAAQVTSAELQAERTAEANDAVRQQDRQDKTADLNAARDAAPAGADAGPKTRAVLGKLREQQAKGH
jgi:hypothetical protein